MDALQIIIPAFTGILGLFIGYFLKKSEYERQRRDELADKEYNRRIQFRDTKIQEAQAYVETYRKACLLLVNIEREMVSKPDAQTHETDPLEKINEITAWTPKRLASIAALNDQELEDLNSQLMSIYNSEIIRAYALRKTILEKKGFDREEILGRLIKLIVESSRLIMAMQVRLDNLAAELK